VAVNAAEKSYGRQIGQLQIRLATGFTGLGAIGSCGAEQSGNCGGTNFRQSIQSHSTTVGPGILKPGSHERFLPNHRNRRQILRRRWSARVFTHELQANCRKCSPAFWAHHPGGRSTTHAQAKTTGGQFLFRKEKKLYATCRKPCPAHKLTSGLVSTSPKTPQFAKYKQK
jgi:hypothetical protein